METPEAAWVSMIMERLHAAETQLAALVAPPLAFGYTPTYQPAFFFSVWVPNDRFRDIEAVCEALSECPGRIDVSLMSAAPRVLIEGIAHEPGVMSREAMSQILERLLGRAADLQEEDILRNSVVAIKSYPIWTDVIMNSNIARSRGWENTWEKWPEGDMFSWWLRPFNIRHVASSLADSMFLVCNNQSRSAVKRIRSFVSEMQGEDYLHDH